MGRHQVPAQDQLSAGSISSYRPLHRLPDARLFFGKPDEKRFLGGSEERFEIPKLGMFHGPNSDARMIGTVSATGGPSKS